MWKLQSVTKFLGQLRARDNNPLPFQYCWIEVVLLFQVSSGHHGLLLILCQIFHNIERGAAGVRL